MQIRLLIILYQLLFMIINKMNRNQIEGTIHNNYLVDKRKYN